MPTNSALVLDGAAGTYLEAIGVKLHPKLWSSGELLTPTGYENIKKLHRAYLQSGADILTSVTYQASIPGFTACGLTEDQGFQLIKKGVELARNEADDFTKNNSLNKKIMVAAGLGPYGAYLSHGEEYTGDYGATITRQELASFWIPRVKASLEGNPDCVLFETIPNFIELETIIKDVAPLVKSANKPVWISLSLKIDGNRVTLADGTSIDRIKTLIQDNSNRIDLIGANCFAIESVPNVIEALKDIGLPLIIYPNSGEIYDGVAKTWKNPNKDQKNHWEPALWASNGVQVIGGCCRTTPEIIGGVSKSLHT